MLKPTHFLAAGFATVALLLGAPAAHAQTTAFAAATTEEAASRHPDEAMHNLSAPAEFTSDAYYDDSHKDLRQTLAWMQETNALHPAYHTMYAEARIRLQLKDYTGAYTTASEAKKLALAAANSDYARRSEEVMTKANTHGK